MEKKGKHFEVLFDNCVKYSSSCHAQLPRDSMYRLCQGWYCDLESHSIKVRYLMRLFLLSLLSRKRNLGRETTEHVAIFKYGLSLSGVFNSTQAQNLASQPLWSTLLHELQSLLQKNRR